MDRIATILLIALILVAGCTRGYDPEPPAARIAPSPTLTIESLHALYREGVAPINQELIVAGVVTSSDLAGNFYRTLCIEQQGYGLEILVGGSALHSRYPPGIRLHLRLKGLALCRSRGVLQAGLEAPAYSYPELDYLTAQPLIDEHLFRVEAGAEPEPLRCSIAELSPELCGALVCVEGLHHEPLTEESPTLEGYHRFCDPSGQALHLYISSYARFAHDPVPRGELSLCGILQHLTAGEQAGYIIKPSYATDIRTQ